MSEEASKKVFFDAVGGWCGKQPYIGSNFRQTSVGRCVLVCVVGAASSLAARGATPERVALVKQYPNVLVHLLSEHCPSSCVAAFFSDPRLAS